VGFCAVQSDQYVPMFHLGQNRGHSHKQERLRANNSKALSALRGEGQEKSTFTGKVCKDNHILFIDLLHPWL